MRHTGSFTEMAAALVCPSGVSLAARNIWNAMLSRKFIAVLAPSICPRKQKSTYLISMMDIKGVGIRRRYQGHLLWGAVTAVVTVGIKGVSEEQQSLQRTLWTHLVLGFVPSWTPHP